MLIHTELLLMYLFVMYQEVSPSIGDCELFTYWCGDYFCCSENCCYKNLEMPGEAKTPWFLPVIAIFGTFIGFSCLMVICSVYCKTCKGSAESRLEESPRNRPIPSPNSVPPLPTAPPGPQTTDLPPPYSEVVWKPDFYPAPMEQPPAYDNIAMDVLSTPDTSLPPVSMPKDNS